MTAYSLDMPLAELPTELKLKAVQRAFEYHTVRDLLNHVPRRYSRRGDLTPISDMPIGEHVTVVAQVLSAHGRRMQRRPGTLLEVLITDGRGTMTLTFFNQAWRQSELQPGVRGTFAGKVRNYGGKLQLQHPDYELFHDAHAVPGAAKLDAAAARAWSETPVPIYPATATVTSVMLQRVIGEILDNLGEVYDPLPDEIRRTVGVMGLRDTMYDVHQPRREQDWQSAQSSLKFREAFDLQLFLLQQRSRVLSVPSAPRPLTASGSLRSAFDNGLPFTLTDDQQRVGETISRELASAEPMHRLLQGEVGSGKTVVALRGMLQVAEDGGQSALLAPTEVLAAQHYRSIIEALGPDLTARVNPVLITGKMPISERRRAHLSLASGVAQIAVGTHALLSDTVHFFDLGLVVIDEQHRFGVDQREALRRKGTAPHVLTMTATPIPRTVALTAFGDLETLTIRELPPGRQGIETFTVPEREMPARAARVWERASEDVERGRQVYVVCPAISAQGELEGGMAQDEMELAGAGSDGEEAPRPIANVTDTLAELQAMPRFANVRMEALTGELASADKERVMSAFERGEIDVLVATTVIEVGINVPNATVMIVRDADRFGVSQLHQLRGRVGRGTHPGLCLLMTHAPPGSVARERVEAVAATSDGFDLAEIDLELRREGDILGTVQSGGRSTLKLLRVTRDGDVIVRAREVAQELLRNDPHLEQLPVLAAHLARYGENGKLENLSKS